MNDDPIKPLTAYEWEVAELVGKGWTHRRIAKWLGIHRSTVRVFIFRVAGKLDNPEGLPATRLVFLWAAHREWLKKHESPKDDAA